MDKRVLVDQLVEKLRKAARIAEAESDAAAIHARDGATAGERVETSQTALEFSRMARAQAMRAREIRAAIDALLSFRPKPLEGRARVELGALVVEQAEGETGLVELAVPPFPAGRTCLARVVVESDREDKLDVLYRTARQPRYHRGQVASAAVHPGTNVVHVRLDAEDLLGPLRVRCGARPGRSVLREVELRLAVP